ncbi:MAG TPA: flagellar motor protein MotA [Alphaproteobacteria bacterium]|nr:flagellar motor protein MotA [Alphaproteobacteria bacterium]
MSQPKSYLFRMGLFVFAVAITLGVLYVALKNAFMANPVLNGVIIGILLIGILYSFRQVITLGPAARWIESFQRNQAATAAEDPPRILASMATLLRDRDAGPLRLTSAAMRSLLDGIGSRLDETREISRYMIGLLIFLGLLGTFWGLLETVSAVAGVVGSLSIGTGDITSIFGELKRGLQAPLTGMGTAFSSSLFGLGGSLILGFLDLQAGQSQNRFYNELEEWLSGQTRLATTSGMAGMGEGEASVPAYIQALLEQTAENIDKLQHSVSREDDRQATTNAHMTGLAEKVGAMSEQMSSDIRLLAKTIAAMADRNRRN